MRVLLVSVSVLVALGALGLARDATGRAVAHPPRLALTSAQPLIISGRQFRAHERMSLVLHQLSAATRRRTRAGRHGVFRKVFAGVTVDRCRGFWVSAKGSSGPPRHARAPRAAAVSACIAAWPHGSSSAAARRGSWRKRPRSLSRF